MSKATRSYVGNPVTLRNMKTSRKCDTFLSLAPHMTVQVF